MANGLIQRAAGEVSARAATLRRRGPARGCGCRERSHCRLIRSRLSSSMPPVSTIHATELRAAMGRFATGVAVVTATHPELGPFGSTANSVSSVSLDPPLVLVCLKLESETLAALEAAGAFAVNVLAEDQLDLAGRFAKSGARWDGVATRRARPAARCWTARSAPSSASCTSSPTAATTGSSSAACSACATRAPRRRRCCSPARSYHGLGDPLAPRDRPPHAARRPARAVRDWGDGVTMVATRGRPRGTAGAELYVHRAAWSATCSAAAATAASPPARHHRIRWRGRPASSSITAPRVGPMCSESPRSARTTVKGRLEAAAAAAGRSRATST